MNTSIYHLALYVLILHASALTIGLAWFLIIGRSLAQKGNDFDFDKEFEDMRRRIKKRNELNGRATDHNINLDVAHRGDWTGPIPRSKKAPPKPPHNPHK
jgi:hypothetical protein